jgi:hypothetical protein
VLSETVYDLCFKFACTTSIKTPGLLIFGRFSDSAISCATDTESLFHIIEEPITVPSAVILTNVDPVGGAVVG